MGEPHSVSVGDARLGRAIHRLPGAFTVVVAGLSGWLLVARLTSTADGEWMAGAVRDGVARVRDGQPLYAEPTARFVPFVYPPLYFWVAALFARVLPLAVSCKVVSLASSVASGVAVYRLSAALGASKVWARLSIALFIATYPLTLFFYDIERVDALYAAMVLWGTLLLVDRRTWAALAWTIAAGMVLGGSFFAKQGGLFAFAAAALGLAAARERKRAAVFAASGAAVIVVVAAYLHASTHGFFDFYCLELPRGHGVRAARLSLFFVEDVPRTFSYALGTIAFALPTLRAALRRGKTAEDSMRGGVTVFAFVLVAGAGAAFFFRAHAGGWANVLIAWLPLACVAAAVAASRAEESARDTTAAASVGALLHGGVALQLCAALFDPTEVAPNADDARDRAALVELVRQLEGQGEVLVTTTGGITRATSAHAAAVEDIVRANKAAPRDLVDGLEERRFVAMLVGAPDEYDCAYQTCQDLVLAVGRNYFIAARLHEPRHKGMSGYDGRAKWLLRPRHAPLPRTTTRDELTTRQRIEMGLGQAQEARSPLDKEVEPDDGIEENAQAILSEKATRPSSP